MTRPRDQLDAEGQEWWGRYPKGPGTSTDNAIPRWDGTGGGVLQDSGITIGDSDEVAGVAGFEFSTQTAEPATQSLYVQDGTLEADGALIWDSTVVVGAVGAFTVGGSAVVSMIRSTSLAATQTSDLTLQRHSTTMPANIILARNNADTATHTVVSDDDLLGAILFLGSDGTDYAKAAEIRCYVDGTPGSGDMPGRIEFYVSADGGETPAKAMAIKQDKSVVIENFLELPEISTPGNPPSGFIRLYSKASGHLFIKDDAGNETDLGGV